MQIVDFMFQTPSYTQDYLVRMAHHTTALEGNTLTQQQTASILLEGFIFGGVSEREYYEVKNYKKVLPYILENIRDNQPLTPSVIKEIHRLTMDNLIENAGSFKTIPNLVVGANFETTKPYLVPTRIQEFCQNLKNRIQQSKTQDEKLKSILRSHFDFERIHPFSDGNGRVGRLLIFYSCLQENIVPPIIEKGDKPKYISCLREENLERFFELAKQIQKKEKERIKIFELNQKQQSYCTQSKDEKNL